MPASINGRNRSDAERFLPFKNRLAFNLFLHHLFTKTIPRVNTAHPSANPYVTLTTRDSNKYAILANFIFNFLAFGECYLDL